MNKRIFTLLASSLMLFLTALVVNAQSPGFYGSAVPFLPNGMGKGAYHLKVSSFGTVVADTEAGQTNGYWSPSSNVLLALTDQGFLELVNYDDGLIEYQNLRRALWCVNVIKPERLGQQPAYNFINKAFQTPLSVDTGAWTGTDFNLLTTGLAPSPQRPGYLQAQKRGLIEEVFVGGQFGDWAFSHEYENYLMKDQPLLIEIPKEPDYFMTFGFVFNGSMYVPRLVKVHSDDVKPGAPFYEERLIRFTLVNAAPRVLTEDDFNSTLYTKTSPDNTSAKMVFDPDVTKNQTNVLAQELRAYASPNNNSVIQPFNRNYYLNFRKPASNNRGAYIYVADGDDEDNYFNEESAMNIHYPKILEIPWADVADVTKQFDFRLVYYPSEDSLIINVRGIDHILPTYGNQPTPYAGEALDLEGYNLGDDLMYNREIWDFLIVRLQDLNTALGDTVITVSNRPANTRIHFGINNCEISDDRIAVPRNLYVIRDQLGRYLVMPLHLGDFTPQWLEPRENEDPMKTPSYQWLVYPMNDNSPNSSVTLINREFDQVMIEFSNVYKSYHWFDGHINWLHLGKYPNGAFDNIWGVNSDAYIYYSDDVTAPPTMLPAGNKNPNRTWNIKDGWHGSFLIVQDDQAVAAKVTAKIELTQEEMQKLHRTSPYIGYKYIAPDTLNYHTYAFNYLHEYSKDYYLGPKPNQTKDTILYAIGEKNHFQLILPDNRSLKFGAEKYGIGWDFNLKAHKATEDIAPLERAYYHFKESDYWNFSLNENFVVLGENARYGFTNEAGANMRGTEKATFYLRFTYQPAGMPEYYTLLERILESSAYEEVKRMGLQITRDLKVHDISHDGTWFGDSLGVLVLGIDNNTLFSRAHDKVRGNLVSTFAVSHETEPLYRRFNEGLYYPSGIDAGVDDGGEKGSDDPRLVKIYRNNYANVPKVDYLYEDAHSVNARDYYTKDSKGINYLSLENIFIHNDKLDQNVGHNTHGNFSFYLDTAYVNRGTGHIKPQYLIVVGPQKINEQGCFLCGEPIDLRKGLYGRFLINATDSARCPGWVYGSPGYCDADYIWETKWDRLVFVPGIHIGDSLYILRGGQDYESLRSYTPLIIRTDEYGEEYLHLPSLIAAAKVAKNMIDIHPLDNNLHKDVVFSMRFYERGNYEDFLLESETTERDTSEGLMIAPMSGGWVKEENGEMVINRRSYKDHIMDGERWNTEPTTDEPVANDKVAATAVKVIGGEGSVTILNAAGKRVTISNVLGQTVASAVLASDNASIAAPNGVLVVAVEGENAVKAVVK